MLHPFLWTKLYAVKTERGHLPACGPEILNECKRLWVLKNSFQGISTTKFVRKLLRIRSPKTLKFTKITALVPFSTPTPDYVNHPDASPGLAFPVMGLLPVCRSTGHNSMNC
jgi:hypothetical protein